MYSYWHSNHSNWSLKMLMFLEKERRKNVIIDKNVYKKFLEHLFIVIWCLIYLPLLHNMMQVIVSMLMN